jgi:hypothetical protein
VGSKDYRLSLTDEFLAYGRKYINPAREELVANTIKANELRARGDTAGAERLLELSIPIMDKQYQIAANTLPSTRKPSKADAAPWELERVGIERVKKCLVPSPLSGKTTRWPGKCWQQ